MGCGASKTTGSATLAPAPVSKPIALRTHEVDEVSDNSGNSVKRASTGNEPAPPPLAETPRSDGINLAEENAHKVRLAHVFRKFHTLREYVCVLYDGFTKYYAETILSRSAS